jgi:hypothetical protein
LLDVVQPTKKTTKNTADIIFFITYSFLKLRVG